MARSRKQPAADSPFEGLFVATETFSTDIDGTTTLVQKGQLVRAGDKRLQGGYFRPATEADVVEQATAGPGEHRTVSW